MWERKPVMDKTPRVLRKDGQLAKGQFDSEFEIKPVLDPATPILTDPFLASFFSAQEILWEIIFHYKFLWLRKLFRHSDLCKQFFNLLIFNCHESFKN